MNFALLLNIGIILIFSGVFLLLPSQKHTKKFGIILLIICLAIELFVCNFHSFHLLFRDYDKKELSFETASISTEGLDSISKTVVSFNNLNQRIGTIYFDITLHETKKLENGYISTITTDKVNVKIDAKDETYSKSYRYNTANGTIIRNNNSTNTVIMNMSGKVSDLVVTLSTDNGELFALNSVTVNKAVPFNISSFRFILIFGIIFGTFVLLNSNILQKGIDETSSVFAKTVFVITTVFLIIAVVITVLYNMNNTGIVFNSLKQTSGNQISQELVDAFEAGQVSLLDTPNEELLSMENPYDWGARSEAKISYKWDHLLFDGKYYSYYGIAPVILLFLPFHLLTGFYFPTPEAVMIFGIIGITFLSLLYYEFVKKFFKKLPLSIALASLIVLQTSSSVWYCFASPLFYEIAQSSGFAFTCAGFYFLIKSNVISEGRVLKRHLIFSSFCLSCAVLCRPTLAVYCIAALLFIGIGFFKNRLYAKETNQNIAKSTVAYLASTLSFFVVIGGIQMIYNYARFGSFFDFGIQYSLTINDFTRAEYHTDFVTIGFWNYLFASPIIKPEFPFVFSNFSPLDTNGYYFIANTNAVGIFYRALPSLALFLSPFAFKVADKKKRLVPALLVLVVCIICPLVIIFSIWESGYGVRYAADFAWQMILGGMIVIYYLFFKFKLKNNTFANRFVTAFFVYSALVSLFINSSIMYDYINKDGCLEAAFLSFERLFEFWL
ncbi:MAG: hypothetical protein IKU48_00800 [Clostridia bacterium]|nr:hypothetical protein [Clostridia bacterium]